MNKQTIEVTGTDVVINMWHEPHEFGYVEGDEHPSPLQALCLSFNTQVDAELAAAVLRYCTAIDYGEE